jgi:hypothetical protein
MGFTLETAGLGETQKGERDVREDAPWDDASRRFKRELGIGRFADI